MVKHLALHTFTTPQDGNYLACGVGNIHFVASMARCVFLPETVLSTDGAISSQGWAPKQDGLTRNAHCENTAPSRNAHCENIAPNRNALEV